MTINLWVNGEEYVAHSEKTIGVENPATGKVVDQLALADKHCLDHVVEIAREAQKEWGRTALAKRVDIMFKFRQLVIEHQDEIADAIVREGGKTHGDALGEIARGRETIDFACGINAALKGEFTDQASTGVDVHTLRQPVGVVAGICPFNFPAMVPMWMHPVALATGNAFILKVASVVPSASLIIARLYKEAGLPDGLFNVIAGDRHLVTDILTHPGIDAISFVGSTPVAHIVQDTGVAHGKRVQALGGANNHAIVMPDADIEFAAQHISAGAFGAAGQRCMALPVIVTVGGVEEKLVPAIKARAEKIVVGPGTDPASEMGPVITRSSQERITKWIDEAEAKGANIVLDGRGYRPEGEEYADGFWLAPTIIAKRSSGRSWSSCTPTPTRKPSRSSTPPSLATAPRSSPPTVIPPATSSSMSRPVWLVSTCRSRFRSRTTRSVVGRSRCWATLTSMAPRACASTRRRRLSRPAGPSVARRWATSA